LSSKDNKSNWDN